MDKKELIKGYIDWYNNQHIDTNFHINEELYEVDGYLQSLEQPEEIECKHKFIDATNRVVKDTMYCEYCGKIIPLDITKL